MVSDVPVGIFLSGGIDSSILAAVLQKHVGDIHSFTIGFDERISMNLICQTNVAET